MLSRIYMKKQFLALMVLVSLLPATALFAAESADTATVKINVVDGKGDPIPGVWFLHQFSTQGPVVRNGLRGETFSVPAPMTYSLEVNRVLGIERYEAYQILSANPQVANAGDVLTFNVQYFRTAVEMEANANRVVEATVVDVPAAESQAFSVPTSPVAENQAPAAEVSSETSPAVEDEPISADEPKVPAKPELTVYNSELSVPPQQEEGSAVLGVSTINTGDYTLAQTGPSALLLLIPSLLSGILSVKRRK